LEYTNETTQQQYPRISTGSTILLINHTFKVDSCLIDQPCHYHNNCSHRLLWRSSNLLQSVATQIIGHVSTRSVLTPHQPACSGVVKGKPPLPTCAPPFIAARCHPSLGLLLHQVKTPEVLHTTAILVTASVTTKHVLPLKLCLGHFDPI
jgi:hypothetical protein